MTDFETKDSGERAQFDSGMQRDTESGKARFDLTQPLGVPYDEQLLTRFAKLMGRGADKYTERNWEQATGDAELARFKSSAFRHFMQWYAGERDEDHAAAVMFNLMGFEATSYKMGLAEAVSDAEPEMDDWEASIIADAILEERRLWKQGAAQALEIRQPSDERPPYIDNHDLTVEDPAGIQSDDNLLDALEYEGPRPPNSREITYSVPVEDLRM